MTTDQKVQQDQEVHKLAIVISSWIKFLVSNNALKMNLIIQGIYWLAIALYSGIRLNIMLISDERIESGSIGLPGILDYCTMAVGIVGVLAYSIALIITGIEQAGGKRLRIIFLTQVLIFVCAPLIPSDVAFFFRLYYAVAILQTSLMIKLEHPVKIGDYHQNIVINPNFMSPYEDKDKNLIDTNEDLKKEAASDALMV